MMLPVESLLTLLVLLSSPAKAVARPRHTNIIIIGGTGDLARKYLWSGSLNLFLDNYNENNTFTFYAGARVSQETGDKTLEAILEKVTCPDLDDKCYRLRPEFLHNTHYAIMKTTEHYAGLCKKLRSVEQVLDKQHVAVRQIFYLSVPSSAYESVAKEINDNCRDSSITTQIVLEKPFGLDRASASEQISTISKYFSDDEVQRVDHYLAKSVTKQILSFRFSNKDKLEDLLNNQYVDRVEIVMKERIGVKGRIDFYDQTGLVRDVMQNHLTELLALVAMDLPSNVTDSSLIENHKLHLLRHVKPVSRDALLTGQYLKYVEEAKAEIQNINQSHFTATFAAALLRIENQRWYNVPFVLMSGKHMDERSSYVRILFREKEFCVCGCAGGNSTFTKYPRQLIFQLGQGSVPSAGILVSRSLITPTWPQGMRELPMTSKDSTIHGQSPGDFHYATPVNDDPAYFTVLYDLYHNIRETFVTASRLSLLWDIWDSVVKESRHVFPRLYKEYDASNLNFTVFRNSLQFIEKSQAYRMPDEQSPPTIMTIPSEFRNHTLISAETDKLVNKLSQYLLNVANTAVKDRGTFHVAFSGGKTPVLLFKELANNFPLFPWKQTHFWQVDERCVSYNNEQSNFKSLNDHLMQHVQIPYFNIHPMTVNFAGKICDPKNNGDKLYEDLIKHSIAEQKLDVVLLGLGTDGHTASLFPHNEHLTESTRLVSLTKSKTTGSRDRMSLLPPLINSAREIIVVVTGKDKHNIVHIISDLNSKDKAYPITYISPTEGNMTWYIDLNAWVG